MPADLYVYCPHGDPTCPCQDGDMCHYEGPDPMQAPVCHYPTCTDLAERDWLCTPHWDLLAKPPVIHRTPEEQVALERALNEGTGRA